jgi:hypothetical protein
LIFGQVLWKVIDKWLGFMAHHRVLGAGGAQCFALKVHANTVCRVPSTVRRKKYLTSTGFIKEKK